MKLPSIVDDLKDSDERHISTRCELVELDFWLQQDESEEINISEQLSKSGCTEKIFGSRKISSSSSKIIEVLLKPETTSRPVLVFFCSRKPR
jgi:hypothetical protein